MRTNRQITTDIARLVMKLHHLSGASDTEISRVTGLPRATCYNIRMSEKWQKECEDIINDSKKVRPSLFELTSPDVKVVEVMPKVEDVESVSPEEHAELIEYTERVRGQLQHQRDANRVERKTFRETARTMNVLEVLNQTLIDTLKHHALNIQTNGHEDRAQVAGAPVGVIHLSDIHFNEIVDDVMDNRYDFAVASARLKTMIDRCTRLFMANDVTSVAVFMTGDMLNSDRRMDEIIKAPTNRSRAVFIAVEILLGVILHLNENFTVTVASVTGNESRVGEHIGLSDFVASDSYDLTIHNMLGYLLANKVGVNVLPILDPLEKVVDVNGQMFLLIHGHGHGRASSTSNIETAVEKMKSRFAQQGVVIRYVLSGHIHQAYVSDWFGRSSGLPGSNSYSERGLNLVSRASQNAYLVYADGTIDGFKMDLQNVDLKNAYSFNHDIMAFNMTGKRSGTVTIQSVLI